MQRRAFVTLAALLPSLALLPQRTRAQAVERAFARATNRKEFDTAIRRARAQKKPVLAYFTAEWCAICKSIDSHVFSYAVLKARLANITEVRVDLPAIDEGNRALMQHLRVSHPPTMFVISPTDGRELPRTRLIGAVGANLFLDTINLADL